MTRVACFVSPHGFGHAARCCAAMEALARLRPDLEVDVFSTVPRWFLEESLTVPWRLHEVETDIGLRQRSALEADVERTVEALAGFLPLDGDLANGLAEVVRRRACRLVVCDIAPLGIEVARRAGLTSVLVENFTWDWIYAGYLERAPALGAYVTEMRALFAGAGVHVQTVPVCRPDPEADLVTAPVSRLPRSDREDARRALGVDGASPVVLVTMGGVPHEVAFGDELRKRPGIRFLVTGAPRTAVEGNVHWFDNGTPLYLPDLVRAADVVVAKLGYSTVAEVWREGRPFAYVTRGEFRESPVLERFVRSEIGGFAIAEEAFQAGDWLDGVEELLRGAQTSAPRVGGNERLAGFLHALLG